MSGDCRLCCKKLCGGSQAWSTPAVATPKWVNARLEVSLPCGSQKLDLKDSKLVELSAHGIAIHHAGLDYPDRHSIEDAFKSGNLHLIVSTSVSLSPAQHQLNRIDISRWCQSTRTYGCHQGGLPPGVVRQQVSESIQISTYRSAWLFGLVFHTDESANDGSSRAAPV